MGFYSKIVDSLVIKLSISVNPVKSFGKFDCALEVKDMNNLDQIEVIDLIRTSKYGTQPNCLPDRILGPLREYCCCKDNKQCAV